MVKMLLDLDDDLSYAVGCFGKYMMMSHKPHAVAFILREFLDSHEDFKKHMQVMMKLRNQREQQSTQKKGT